MAYLGLRANGLYLPTAPYFFTGLPTAGAYLRKIATCSTPVYGIPSHATSPHLGSVSAISSKLILSAALVASEAEDGQTKFLDDILSTSRFLRSIPLASTLLLGRIDNKTYDAILTSLLRTPQDHQCAALRAVASEIQLAPGHEARHVPSLRKRSADRTSHHNKFGLFLENFPSGRVAEKDFTMLAAKIIEDPDFPVVPPWHDEFSTLRPWLDIALALSQDCDSDIFVHELLVKKVLLYYNKHMVAPSDKQLDVFRWSAAKKAQEVTQADVEAAALLEPGRLLQIKIEDLIPKVANTEEGNKALRKISLSDLNIPRILKYRDRSVILLLSAKMRTIMRTIMRDSKHVADIDDICICDIISQYSDDEGEDHFNSPSALENIFPQRKRNTVLDWASSIETPVIHHIKFSEADETYCEPLEPIGKADNMTEVDSNLQKASEITWELQGCSLEFPRGHDGKVLLGYGYQADQEVSEGHFTNMISAASASETSSDASANEDEGMMAANRRNSDTSLESGGENTKDSYDYHRRCLAMASIELFNKRRLKNLQLAWGVPHPAHSPEQMGYHCDVTKSSPRPDWDLEHVSRTRFTIPKKAPGLLGEFYADYEAKHVDRRQNRIDEQAFRAP